MRLELGGVGAAIHASGQCTALEAMAGQIAPAKTGRDGARLDDVGDGASGERRFANLGQGRGASPEACPQCRASTGSSTPASRSRRARRAPRAAGARFAATPGRR